MQRTPAFRRPAFHPLRPIAAAVGVICATWPVLSAAAGVTGLGAFHGGMESEAYAVSGDGRIVVGGAIDGATANYHAFRWTSADGMQDLGLLNGGTAAIAMGISQDGGVIVGGARDGGAGGAERAVRWTAAGGIQSLGTLNGGNLSWAYGVSGDGRVVVGDSSDGALGNALRAFRWTASDGMQSLGTLNGGSASTAWAVNMDGSVIVGDARDGADGDASHAFRWTGTGGMQNLGVLNGGAASWAYGVSGDGAVVVGEAYDGAGGGLLRAFRWTATDGMQSLGVLNGGDVSSAKGISTDGRVIVGTAWDGAVDAYRGFRWTQSGGMQSVEDWLRANGVTVATDHTQRALGTNRDGSVVVGALDDDMAFVARVSDQGSGLVSLKDLAQSLSSTSATSVQVQGKSDMVLHGAHGHPLSRQVAPGRNCLWTSGDWGRDDHGQRNGSAGLAEIGGCHGFADGVQASLAVGQTWSRQSLVFGGNTSLDGTYALAEVLVGRPGGWWGTLSAYYHTGDIDVRRGYLNAGTPDISRGQTPSRTWGLRARVDREAAFVSGKFSLTPYAELTHLRTRIDAYTETGGGFPARFDARQERTTEARAGVEGVWTVSDDTRLSASVAAVHRFEKAGSRTRGQVIGLFSFDQAGEAYQRDWLHASVGVEQKAGPGVLSLHLNATTRGQDANVWLAAGYRVTF